MLVTLKCYASTMLVLCYIITLTIRFYSVKFLVSTMIVLCWIFCINDTRTLLNALPQQYSQVSVEPEAISKFIVHLQPRAFHAPRSRDCRRTKEQLYRDKIYFKALLRWSVIKGLVRRLNELWPERDSCVQRIRDRTSNLSLPSSCVRVMYVVIYYGTTAVYSQLMWMFDQDKCFVTRELYRLRTLTSPNVLIMVERCANLCLENWYLFQ